MTEEQYSDAQDEYGEDDFTAWYWCRSDARNAGRIDLEEELETVRSIFKETGQKPSAKSYVSVLS